MRRALYQDSAGSPFDCTLIMTEGVSGEILLSKMLYLITISMLRRMPRNKGLNLRSSERKRYTNSLCAYPDIAHDCPRVQVLQSA